MGIVNWTSPDLERLLLEAIPSDLGQTYGTLCQCVNLNHGGLFPVVGQDGAFAADAMTAILERSSSVIVGRPMSAISLSPVMWSIGRSLHYTTGEARQRMRQIRHALVRYRFAKRWNVRLINCRTIARRIYADFSNKKATPVESIRILPSVLRGIQDGSVKLCLLEDTSPFEDLRRYTFSANWRVELQFRPGDSQPARQSLEAGGYAKEINDAVRRSMAAAYPNLECRDFSSISLNAAFKKGTVYSVSRSTVLRILDSIQELWSRKNSDFECTDEARSALQETRDAIIAHEDLSQDSQPELATAYKWKASDVAVLRQFLREQFNLLGDESLFQQPLSIESVRGKQKDDPFQKLTFDDASGKARWGKRVLDISSGDEYFLLKHLHTSSPKPVSYTKLLQELKPGTHGKGITIMSADELKDPIAKIRNALKKCPGCTLYVPRAHRNTYQLRGH